MKIKFLIPLALFYCTLTLAEDEPKAAVSVILDGKDLSHVKEVVTEAKNLSSKVPIRNLLLIEKIPNMRGILDDSKKENSAEQEKIEFTTQNMQAGMEEIRILNLENSEGKTDLSLLEKLRVTNSPTWIVRFKGKNYIYEGFPSIDRYFTANGDFKEGE